MRRSGLLAFIIAIGAGFRGMFSNNLGNKMPPAPGSQADIISKKRYKQHYPCRIKGHGFNTYNRKRYEQNNDH